MYYAVSGEVSFVHNACNCIVPVRLTIYSPIGAHVCTRTAFPKHVGTHPLWQYPLSFPMVQGADNFYNSRVERNSSYVPPSDVHGKGGSNGIILYVAEKTSHLYIANNIMFSIPLCTH